MELYFIYFFLFLITGLIAAYFVRSPSKAESVEKISDQSFKEALLKLLKQKVIFCLYQVFLYVVFILL